MIELARRPFDDERVTLAALGLPPLADDDPDPARVAREWSAPTRHLHREPPADRRVGSAVAT